MKSKSYASELLRAVGMSPKYKGYAYVLHMLDLAVEDISRTQNMSLRLYALTCEHYHVSPITVERNARFAIRRTWEADHSRRMHRLFEEYGIFYAPTNREFICVLADCASCKSTTASMQMCMW